MSFSCHSSLLSAHFAPSPCPVQFKEPSFLTRSAMTACLTGLPASRMVHFWGLCTHSYYLFQNLNLPLQLWCIDCHLQNTQKAFLSLYIICLCLFACFLASFLFRISKVIHVYYRKYRKTDYRKEENKITHTSTTQIKVNHFEHFGMHFSSKANSWICLSIYINLVIRACLLRKHFDLITHLLFVLKIAWMFQVQI